MPGDARAGRRLTRGLVVLGVGLGAFIDGIVFHQILQWHHMISSVDAYPAGTLAGLEANTLADGLFHATAWLASVAGIVMVAAALASGARRRPRAQLGLVLVGIAAFNITEGLINHHLLGVHHVREGVASAPYDLGFLLISAFVGLAGLSMARTGTIPRSL